MALQIDQKCGEVAAAPERKIVYSQIEDGTSGEIGEIHDRAQDRLARGLHAQTSRQAGSSFAAGGQADGGELLAISDRNLCPGANQVRKALCKDLALTERIAAEVFAHVESKLDTATNTRAISHRLAVPTINVVRLLTAVGS